jgi:rod shape-determining protein MreB
MVTTTNKKNNTDDGEGDISLGQVSSQPLDSASMGVPVTHDEPTHLADPSLDTEQAIIYIGMDLGTSRTAIAVSNGVRESFPSLVGYPKDVVAKKLLGREVLFGKDVIKHRLSLKAFRPLEAGVIKGSDGANDVSVSEAADNMTAARELVKYAITAAKAPADSLVYCTIGAPAEASINNRHAILEAAKEVIDSVIICSEPFSVAYGMNVLTDALVIDIGAGTTDLCRMKGTMPDDEDQLTLDHGGDVIDEKLAELIKKNHPEVAFSKQMITDVKELSSTVRDNAEPIIVEWPVNGKPTNVDITAEMREACLSIVPPIVNALGKLVASFDPEFQVVLRHNVLLGGGGSQIRGLADAVTAYMNEHLGGGKVVQVEEPVFGGANGALSISKDMPREFWEQLS